MQFNSYYFILYFMPICLFLYYVGGRVKGKIKVYKLVLIVSSLFLFGCYGKDSLLLLILSLITNYTFIAVSKYIRWKKLFMAIPIVVNILLLFYFKYLNFTIDSINSFFGTSLPLQSIILPIGISFFTFQQIAYIVAVYKGEVKPGIIDYSCYILYFPKLVMGPLMDPVDFHEQINDVKVNQINVDHIAYGIKIFSYGLLKKVLLADTFYKAVEYGFSNSGANSSMDWLLIMLFYTFEIYFDFSGYSDMAIGTSLLFNIKLPINFDSPYKALSIRDFWKRWHISLTKFFTKYIYIPLGGNRKGFLFTCLNTMIVFLVSGIWHGANWTFIVWGGLMVCLVYPIALWKKKVFIYLNPCAGSLPLG